jgi:hypothetical protein
VTLDEKLVFIIWRILLKHAVKIYSVVKFSAVSMLPMQALGKVSGPSKGGIPLSIS